MHVVTHVNDVDLAEAFISYVERRLRFALGRFGARVGQVTVRIGADGPGERQCRISTEILPLVVWRSRKGTPICLLLLTERRAESADCSHSSWNESGTQGSGASRFG